MAFYQQHASLAVDRRPGPATRAAIDSAVRFLRSPMPVLPDGRRAVITSGFKTRNPSRPNHDGVDFFYEWRPGDEPHVVGNSGAAGRNADGSPRWVVPYGIAAVGAAPGRVTFAGNTTTGHQVTVNHGNGLLTIYNHLTDTLVRTGEVVHVGTPIGHVGDNPADGDARHLHFGLREVNGDWLDPELFLLA